MLGILGHPANAAGIERSRRNRDDDSLLIRRNALPPSDAFTRSLPVQLLLCYGTIATSRCAAWPSYVAGRTAVQ
jgi:hypothetical protein